MNGNWNCTLREYGGGLWELATKIPDSGANILTKDPPESCRGAAFLIRGDEVHWFWRADEARDITYNEINLFSNILIR